MDHPLLHRSAAEHTGKLSAAFFEVPSFIFLLSNRLGDVYSFCFNKLFFCNMEDTKSVQ